MKDSANKIKIRKFPVHIFLLLVVLLPIRLLSQNKTEDTLKRQLVCPFEQGYIPASKEAYNWDPSDRKVVMISRVDTLIRSCVNGIVVKVEAAEENSYDIVINVNDLYFWYHGMLKPTVRKDDKVKAGQTIGIHSSGSELEFRMFENERIIDAGKLLNCKSAGS